jgi:hypothetical protein
MELYRSRHVVHLLKMPDAVQEPALEAESEIMRVFCFYCRKPVTNELPEDTIFRAVAECPECCVLPQEARDKVLKDRFG